MKSAGRALQTEIAATVFAGRDRGCDLPILRGSPRGIWRCCSNCTTRFFRRSRAIVLDANEIDLRFRLSPRFTSAGGKATYVPRRGPGTRATLEIAISTTLLFESFAQPGGADVVAGCACRTRLEALRRVFEHELLHVCEFNDFGQSRCSASRFRQLAARWFGHRASDHQLVRPSDRAQADLGIHVGSQVVFEFEGLTLRGIVNRITKRATVLVPADRGTRYSDGRTYLKYYVPLWQLRRGTPHPQPSSPVRGEPSKTV